MKVLLKKKVCDSQEQCMELTRKHRNVLLNEEKKNAEMQTSTIPKLVLRIQFLCLTEPRRC